MGVKTLCDLIDAAKLMWENVHLEYPTHLLKSEIKKLLGECPQVTAALSERTSPAFDFRFSGQPLNGRQVHGCRIGTMVLEVPKKLIADWLEISSRPWKLFVWTSRFECESDLTSNLVQSMVRLKATLIMLGNLKFSIPEIPSRVVTKFMLGITDKPSVSSSDPIKKWFLWDLFRVSTMMLPIPFLCSDMLAWQPLPWLPGIQSSCQQAFMALP